MTGTLIQQLTAKADEWEKEGKYESAQELRRIIEQYVSASPVLVCKTPDAVDVMNPDNGNFEPGPVETIRKSWNIDMPHIPTAIFLLKEILTQCSGNISNFEFLSNLRLKIAELEGGK